MSQFGLRQLHHLPEPLPPRFGIGTTAHWAVNPGGKIVLFVHGFRGNAVDTWTDFPAMLTSDSRLAGIDLLFYGYDGLYTQAGTSAELFLEVIEQLATNPAALFNGTRATSVDFVYSHIVVAAHSLGAVVVRRALLDAADDDAAWVNRVRLVLFAPAHRGAYAAVLASSFLSNQDWWLGKVAGNAALYHTPLLQDLTPGSQVLIALEADSRSALQKTPKSPHLIAHTVVWAEDDKVVINQRFPGDPRAKLIRDVDHRRVCKPSDGFIDPVERVVAAL